MNILPPKNISDDRAAEASLSTPDCFNKMGQEELITLLDNLKHQTQSLTSSPRKILLDHAIQVGQLFLSNLLEIDFHQHLYQQAKSHNEGLVGQLTVIFKMLDVSNPPNQSMDNVSDTGSDPSEAEISHDLQQHIDPQIKVFVSNTLNTPSTTLPFFQNCDEAIPQPHSTDMIELTHNNDHELPNLDVYFFSAFRVYRDGELIDRLSKSRAKQLLKYLILNRTKAIPREVLMDRFWPDHDQNSARNNLNVAVYCLRQALRSEQSNFAHILFKDGCYHINYNLVIKVDTEIFEQHVKAGERLEALCYTTEAIEEYKKAVALYQDEFLAEDLYDDWSLELREHYKFLYVKLLGKLSKFYYQQHALEECIAINRKIISVEVGDEHAHRRLMECFARLNQRHLALRQYHTATEALTKEFDLEPSQETVALYKQIKAQQICEKDEEEQYC